VPAAALRIAIGEFATVLTAGQHALPVKATGSGFQFRFERSEAALADLLAPR
jgi:NAD dependent epimerase/dehydratase family enzyme